MIRSTLSFGLVCVLLACTPCGFARALDSPPDAMVDAGLSYLAVAARADTERPGATDHELELAIRSFLVRYTDIPTASRLILSSHWKDATPGQRQRFTAAYNDHVTRLLVEWVPSIHFEAATVEPYSGDLDEVPLLVKSILQTREGKKIDFILVIHERDGTWAIFDVIAEGISYVKLFRNQFMSEISKFGLENAIRRLEDRSTLGSALAEKPEG